MVQRQIISTATSEMLIVLMFLYLSNHDRYVLKNDFGSGDPSSIRGQNYIDENWCN